MRQKYYRKAKKRRYDQCKPYIRNNKIYFEGKIKRGLGVIGTAVKFIGPLAKLVLGI